MGWGLERLPKESDDDDDDWSVGCFLRGRLKQFRAPRPRGRLKTDAWLGPDRHWSVQRVSLLGLGSMHTELLMLGWLFVFFCSNLQGGVERGPEGGRGGIFDQISVIKLLPPSVEVKKSVKICVDL